jgi:Ca2+-binding EF-hand superfamily protein
MNKRSIHLTVLGSVLGLSIAGLAGLAVAQPSDDHQGHRHPAAGLAERWFDRMDANKDGQLTRAEVDAGSQRLFERLDANKDGEVTHEEAEAGAVAIRNEERAARFKQLDTNGDGRLTQEESKLPQRFFEKLDTNADHALSLEEFSAMPDFGARHREFEFDQADKNHDGKVTKAEAADAAKERFDKVDANHDGVITREELQAHVQSMEKMHGEHGSHGEHAGDSH